MEGINLSDVRVYFSDFFNVDEDIIESYGAVNISLINAPPTRPLTLPEPGKANLKLSPQFNISNILNTLNFPILIII